jgi:hypothetical protein
VKFKLFERLKPTPPENLNNRSERPAGPKNPHPRRRSKKSTKQPYALGFEFTRTGARCLYCDFEIVIRDFPDPVEAGQAAAMHAWYIHAIQDDGTSPWLQ